MQTQTHEASTPDSITIGAYGSNYSYSKSFDLSKKINWTVEELLAGREFSRDKRWLPNGLSAAAELADQSDAFLTQLTQVEMASYSHLFGFVEEFIAPLMAKRSSDHAIDNIDGFNALSNFVSEEIKHMELFREVRRKVDETLDTKLELLDNNGDVAKLVLSHCDGAVLLLTACIEWLTQRHYLEAFKDQEGELDPLTLRIFKAHWCEEAQHAKIDHLETLREFEILSDEQKTVAAKELAGLVNAVDGLLQAQAAMDVRNLESLMRAALPTSERERVEAAILKAKRYTFIGSGVTHPKFQELFEAVFTPAQRELVVAEISHLV
jgi:hypothetical protein